MNKPKPSVSIVVPCRNERAYIQECVLTILAQEPPAGGFEIIIADGMSDDGTRDVLARLQSENLGLRVLDNPAKTAAAGLNSAISIAQGEIIIRMDVHTKYAPDYVRQCVMALEETGADNVGGPWVAEGQGLIGQAIAAAFQSPFAVGGARGHDPSHEGAVDTVYLGCWPRALLDRIGLFDEELVRSEDDELNLRLTRAGGKIWQSPRIKSKYYTRECLRSLFQQQLQYGCWKVRVIQKHKIPASIRHIVPAAFVLSLIILPLMSLASPLAGWTFLGLAGAYSVCNITASFLTARRTGWKILPLLPVVFTCYHFPYGLGFLRGIWDFVIVRHVPSHSYTELTRTSEDQPPQRNSVKG